jgi:hypothetical protein
MTISTGKRRSERLILDVPLVIRGQAADQQTFQEENTTLIVNAHGALLMLETKVAPGQKLLLVNPKNRDEREATVAHVKESYGGLSRVGVEFTRPAPEFWSISSPPADWNLT